MANTSDKDKILSFKDLDMILEVNRKAVEIETVVAEQNEEIIRSLNDSKIQRELMTAKMEKIQSLCEDTSKDLFKIQILFVTGVLTLIAQLIQIFLKK